MSGMRTRAGRFMVVAASIPTQSSGTSVVIRRLLDNFAGHELVFLGSKPNRQMRLPPRNFHYPVVTIPSLAAGIRGERYWRLLSTLPGVVCGWLAIRKYKPAFLLAIFPDEASLLTGFWLHRLTGLPLLVYFSDLYAEDRLSGWQAALSRWLQPRVFRAAVRIIAGNAGMRDFYKRRYGIEAVCLPTCINVPVPEFEPLPKPNHPFIIGYSGNVNATRLSSLRALMRVVGGDPSFEIRYFTPQTETFLRAEGLWSTNTRAMFVADEDDLVRRLSECDALVLPLTFDVSANSLEQLSTCFGTKCYEYFLARRPVLLHCPESYYMAQFFKRWDCGVLVGHPGPEALREALNRLQTDALLRERVVRNALAAAREFAGPRVAATLRATLEEIDAGSDHAPPTPQ